MEGMILGFNEKDGKGTIAGKDDNRYTFTMKDVKDDTEMTGGAKVDFMPEKTTAKEIYGAVDTTDAVKIGKEALSMGKDAAAKAGGFLGKGIIKRFVTGGFDIVTQILAVLMPVIGFVSGGMMGFGGFNIGRAIGGLIGGFFATFIGFGLIFAILEIRDNTRKAAELLSEKNK